jgi:hypothetical protein
MLTFYIDKVTDKGKRVYKRRKETIERSFADSKNLHGLRYACFLGSEHEKDSYCAI